MNLITFGLLGTPSELLGLGFVPGQNIGPSPAAVWAYVLPNGKSAGQNVAEINELVWQLAKIHGLVSGAPLVVTATTRSAGDVSQSIVDSLNGTTVTRL
jgi:hypothetical protein